MAKIKALISFAVTAKPICVFVFAYAKSLFSHDATHMIIVEKVLGVHVQRMLVMSRWIYIEERQLFELITNMNRFGYWLLRKTIMLRTFQITLVTIVWQLSSPSA